jgi:hypothetical protein
VRYVRNGAIIPLSVHYYRSIRVHQGTCFAIFASLWDMKRRISCVRLDEGVHIRYVQDSGGECCNRRGWSCNIIIKEVSIQGTKETLVEVEAEEILVEEEEDR